MKRIMLFVLSALAAVALPGCLQSHTTITVNKDGSGTIVEETTLSAKILDMLKGMGGDQAKNPVDELASEDKAKERAAKLGDGVTLDKVEKIDTPDKKGSRVTYKFADINKLKYKSNNDALANGAPGQQEKDDKSKPLEFKYADGTLTVINLDAPGESKPDGAGEAGEAPEDPAMAQQEAMVKDMLKDMAFTLNFGFPDGIAETNASHVDGNTVTLADIKMGKVLEKPGAFRKLQAAGEGGDPSKSMNALDGLPGVKIEKKKEVSVKLK